MDPITALGAASSVVGIVGFGIQLSQVLYEFGSQVGSARESLHTVLDSIDATTRALNEIHTYLQAEEQNLRDGNHLRLFSHKSLLGVKETADKCLVVFWRIEGTIINTSHSKQEEALVAKLMAFNKSLQTSEKPVLVIDNKLKTLSLGFVDRLRWPYIVPKLEDYSRQLQHYQLSLVLMFSVISLGEQRMKPKHNADDIKLMVKTYAIIQQLATKQDLSAIASEVASGAQAQALPKPTGPSNYPSTKPPGTETVAVNLATVGTTEIPEFSSTQSRKKQPLLSKKMAVAQPAVAAAEASPVDCDEKVAVPHDSTTIHGDVGGLGRQLGTGATTGPREFPTLKMFAYPPPAHAETIDSSSGEPDEIQTAVSQDKHNSDKNVKSSPRLSASPETGVLSSPSQTAPRLLSSGTGAGDTGAGTLDGGSQPEVAAMSVSAPAPPGPHELGLVEYRPTWDSVFEPSHDTGDVTNKDLGSSPEDPPISAPTTSGKEQAAKSGFFRIVKNFVTKAADHKDSSSVNETSTSSKKQEGKNEAVEEVPSENRGRRLRRAGSSVVDPKSHSNEQSKTAMPKLPVATSDVPQQSNQSDNQQPRTLGAAVKEILSRPHAAQAPIPARAGPRPASPPSVVQEPIEITVRQPGRKPKNIGSLRKDQHDGYSSDSSYSSVAESWKREKPVISAYIIKDGRSHSVPHATRLGLRESLLKGLYFLSSREPWYKTYAFLDAASTGVLDDILRAEDRLSEKRIIRLKRMYESRMKFWAERKYAVLAVIETRRDSHKFSRSVRKRPGRSKRLLRILAKSRARGRTRGSRRSRTALRTNDDKRSPSGSYENTDEDELRLPGRTRYSRVDAGALGAAGTGLASRLEAAKKARQELQQNRTQAAPVVQAQRPAVLAQSQLIGTRLVNGPRAQDDSRFYGYPNHHPMNPYAPAPAPPSPIVFNGQVVAEHGRTDSAPKPTSYHSGSDESDRILMRRRRRRDKYEDADEIDALGVLRRRRSLPPPHLLPPPPASYSQQPTTNNRDALAKRFEMRDYTATAREDGVPPGPSRQTSYIEPLDSTVVSAVVRGPRAIMEERRKREEARERKERELWVQKRMTEYLGGGRRDTKETIDEHESSAPPPTAPVHYGRAPTRRAGTYDQNAENWSPISEISDQGSARRSDDELFLPTEPRLRPRATRATQTRAALSLGFAEELLKREQEPRQPGQGASDRPDVELEELYRGQLPSAGMALPDRSSSVDSLPEPRIVAITPPPGATGATVGEGRPSRDSSLSRSPERSPGPFARDEGYGTVGDDRYHDRAERSPISRSPRSEKESIEFVSTRPFIGIGASLSKQAPPAPAALQLPGDELDIVEKLLQEWTQFRPDDDDQVVGPQTTLKDRNEEKATVPITPPAVGQEGEGQAIVGSSTSMTAADGAPPQTEGGKETDSPKIAVPDKTSGDTPPGETKATAT